MDPSAISSQINKILQSQSFAKKNQLRKLLEILFQNINSQHILMPDYVIQELWPGEIKTKRASDVATEMNRLRNALKSYYQDEGASDPVLITLPNRTVPAPDGTYETRWIVATPRPNHGQQQLRRRHAWIKTISLVATAGMIVAMAYIYVRSRMVPEQPRLAHIDGSSLVIMNAQGKELWRKSFPQGLGPDWYYGDEKLRPRTWFADLEGKGHTSVLFAYDSAVKQAHSSVLICYSDRGQEKWRWIPGRELPETGALGYMTFSVGFLKATPGRPSRIVALSDADPWWGGPAQVAVLSTEGKLLSAYWHSGGLGAIVVAAPAETAPEEIIATGNAHGYDHQATLIILDPDHVTGASKETDPYYQIHGMGNAQEKLRLLFPRTDLNQGSFQFNLSVEPAFEHGNLLLKVLQCVAPMGCPIRYEFDQDFHLLAAYPEDDEFRRAHDRFFQNGNDAHALRGDELSALLKVRCLVGCDSEFVPVSQTYNPATSFKAGWTAHHNPNGVWSYGYSSGLTGPVSLFDKTVRNGINGTNAEYWLSSSVDVGTSPSAEYNDGPAYDDGNVSLLQDEFVLVAGIKGQYSDLVFTAHVDAEYAINGNFRGAQYGVGTLVGIVADKKTVLSSTVAALNQQVPFNLKLRLHAGNTVVFAAGPGGGTQNTAVSIKITRPCDLHDKPTLDSAGDIVCSSSAR